MSSSTSSSDRPPGAPGHWGRIALVALAVFVGLEIVTRGLLLPASKDYVRFADYPQRAQELIDAPGLRLAFIGNSATEAGLLPTQFATQFEELTKRPATPGLFLADGSEINTWHFIVNNTFWRRGLMPDWFVVTFFEHGLEDGNRPEIGRLAQAFTTPEDWPDLFALDLPRVSDRGEFLLSTFWATYAARDRIRKRALAAIVPHYQEVVEEIHSLQPRPKAPANSPVRSSLALQRFLSAAQAQGSRVLFVAFPTRDQKVEVAPSLIQAIEAAGMKFLDLRDVPGLNRQHFRDDIHLTPAGAEIYTRYFTKRAAAVLDP